MKHESEALEATLELVRAADPLYYSEDEQPDTEAALRVMLANLPVARSHQPPRRRRVLTLAGVAVGATAATVVALNVIPSGGGGVSNVLNQTGVLVSPARAAQIIARVQRELTHFGPNEIIEYKAVTHQSGGGFVATSSQGQWESTNSPYRELVTMTSSNSQQTGFQSYSEGTTAQDIIQLYDPSQNTIYQPLAKPAWRLTAGPRAGTWTLTVPRAVVYTELARRLPAALRGTERLTISDAQATALRSGAKEVVYNQPDSSYPRQDFSVFTQPKIGTYSNITGYGRPEVPAAWVSGLKAHGLKVRLYGQSAIEITGKYHTTYWFSARTLYPLKIVSRVGKNVVTSRYPVYKVLSGRAASTSLLSISDAHPTAKIVVGERSFYAAEKRLGAA
jgi:hypothetical protein